MKKNIKNSSVLVALLISMFLFSVPVRAAGEKIHFGSEEYQWNLNEISPIGVYAGAEDEEVLSAELIIQYDTEKLEYVSGGELIEPGKISVKKTGTGEEEVMEMLQFLPKMSGTTQVTIQSAVVDTQTGQTTIDNAVSAPIKIPVVEECKLSQITIDGTPIENFQSDITEYEVQVSADTEKLNVQAQSLDAQTQVEISQVNLQAGRNVITITASSLQGNKAVYQLVVIKPETPAQPSVSQNKDEKTNGEKITPNEESSNTQKEQKAEKKGGLNITGRMVALAAGLTAALLFLIGIQFVLFHKKRIQKKGKKVIPRTKPSVEEKAENIEISGIQEELPVVDNREIEIAVKHVTMEFKKEKDESSSIKELAVRTLKGQRHVEKFKALDDVSFTVKKGEVVGIIGTNGSGKSTILKIISGVLTPTKGSVEVDKSKIQLLTLGTGFDFELTGRENVYLNGAVIGYTKEFIDEKYDEIVKFAELEGFMDSFR